MTDNEIQAEVKKGVDLWLEKTYTDNDLQAHMISTVKDSLSTELLHKKQLERLIHKIDELRENQRSYHGGNKLRLPTCKKLEGEMDKLINYLLTTGYNIDRFKNNVSQAKLM